MRDLHCLAIIIPVLNESGRLPPLLQSLAAARARGACLVVVDGGSSDDTAVVAAPLCDRLLLSARGRGEQLVAGVAVTDQPMLWFLHADSLLPDDAANSVVAALSTERSGWGRFDISLHSRDWRLRCVAALMNLRTRVTGIVTGDHGIFVRRAMLARAGGMPDQPLMEDIELSRRLRRLSWPIALSERLTTSSRRWEQRGIVRTVLGMWWLRLRYWFGASPADLARVYYRRDPA